jgi:serine phosphatase RsbU (regulator of sigma subunit)
MVFWKRKSAPPPAPAPAPSGLRPGGGLDDSTTLFLRGDAAEDRKSVQVLLEAIQRVSASRDLESLLDYVVDSATATTGAERGFLVLIDEATDTQVVRVARQRGGALLDPDQRYSTSVVDKVLATETPIRTTVQSDAQALELGASVFDLKLRAVMCVPLKPQDEAVQHASILHKGCLYVDSKAATREFKDEDLALFHALAQHIAIALENASLNLQAVEKAQLQNSLEIAAEIQSGLMPQKPPEVPGLDVFGWYRPADHAAGDFYDFVKTRSGGLAVVVGDVTGHGIGPALITATAQAGLRSYVKVLPDPGGIVTMLNQDLSERMEVGMFLTLFLGVIGDDGHVQVVNAGHSPPLLYRKSTGTIETIDGTGPALGMIEEFEYVAGAPITLAPGDVLLVFTDGLTEARRPSNPDRMFGESGVRAVLSDVGHGGGSARELCETLVENVLKFSDNYREDDMTVLAVRRTE